MENENVEKEPLFPSPERSFLDEEERVTAPKSHLSRKRRPNYITYVLLVAYIPLLVLYALVAFNYVPFTNSSHSIDLNLFPCALRPFPPLPPSETPRHASKRLTNIKHWREAGLCRRCARPTSSESWTAILQESPSRRLIKPGMTCSRVCIALFLPKQRPMLKLPRPGTVFRVSKEDLDYYGVQSLPLADGSGFASEVFMTHELHCLVSNSALAYHKRGSN